MASETLDIRRGLIPAVTPLLFSLGTIILMLSGAMLLPLGVAFALNDAALYAYDLAFIVTGVSGLMLVLLSYAGPKELKLRHGYLLVTMAWTLLPAFAAIPFLIYFPDLSVTDAYFEAMAGLTTTGATVFSGLDGLPPSINLWRGMLQWLGGMGVIVLFVAILPLLGIGGRQVFRAEMPGPMKETQLTPRIAQTAKWLWFIYAALTVLCALLFYFAGMSVLDAVVHSFTTVSLGGFSSHDQSFGFFDSPLIEGIAIVFMLLGGINFVTHFVALREASVKPYWRDWEASWFLGAVLGSVGIVTVFLWLHLVYEDFWTALRYGFFNVVSIGTSTGFATTDYTLWPVFAPVWMLLLGSLAASSGSAGGGIKMIRTQILLIQGWRELTRILHPNAIVPLKVGGSVVANNIVYSVLAFMALYGVSTAIMTLTLLASGLEFMTALSAVVACMTNTGPGLGHVGPAGSYAFLTDFQTWVLTVTMVLGRLELFTVLVIFTPAFWQK